MRSTSLVILTIALLGCTPIAAPAGSPAPVLPTVVGPASPAPAQATPVQDAAPPTPAEASIEAAIQATLDQHAQAWSERDRALLEQTIDPQSGAFRRLVKGQFENYRESALNNEYAFMFNLREISAPDQGFVRAIVDNGGGALAGWTFREVGERWLLSEPSAKQVGERATTTSEHFTFHTYPWAGGVNAEIATLMEEARAEVVETLGREPASATLVGILPAFAVGPPQDSGVLAWYVRGGGRRAADRIMIHAPNTYAFGFYPQEEGWQPALRQTLVHEYTHLAQDRSFTPIVRVPEWMSEGIAEYVSGSSRSWEVAEAVRQDAVIPLIDPTTSDPLKVQDLQHMGALSADVSLAYGLSYSLVAYIVENHGGLTGFWRLAEAYDKHQSLPDALDEAFGVSYDTFEAGWRAWLREAYP